MPVTFIPPLTQAAFMHEAKIYRLYNLDRTIEIFEHDRLSFLSPSKWTDPFEKEFLNISYSQNNIRLNIPTVPSGNPLKYKLFSQCWTGIPESEAFWSVRTPFQDGIRLCVQINAFYNFLNALPEQIFIGKVAYYKLTVLKDPQRIIDEFNNANRNTDLFHMRLLLCKRLQYEYEKEYRIFIIKPNPIRNDVINISPITPCVLFNDIKLHPKIGKYLEKLIKDYFLAKCGIGLNVRKSRFGQSSPIIINEP
jgi:hypothetical protein